MVLILSEGAECSRATAVDLRAHHAQCEINYHHCMALMPDCRGGRESWAFDLDTAVEPLRVSLRLVEAAPYTSTIDLVQETPTSVFLEWPRLRVRLYHDAAMAEVVGWNRHRHWLPVYQYPNKEMYLPDEKMALNRFLGDWLVHCRKLGIACDSFCESIRINKK